MEIRDNSQVDYCFHLPFELRSQLSKPYGILFRSNAKLKEFLTSNKSRIITVGDVVTTTLLDLGITPFLSIIDGKTKRKIKVELNANSERIVNEAGLIRLSAILKIKEVLESNSSKVLYIDGEEDLLVIPIVIYGRKGDIVIYGQPNAGAVMLVIDELMKKRVLDIFRQFRVEECRK